MSGNFLRRMPLAVKILILGALAAAALIFLGPGPKPRSPQASPLPEVPVVAARPQPQSLTVHTQGTVSPRREINLVAEVAGKVVSVAEDFAAGGFFQAGDVLVQIEPRDYKLALTRAEARVAEAEQALALEQARARQAKQEWRDLGSAEANDLFLRKPQLAAAEAQLAAARAEREQAALNLERTRITVPFDGRIREKHADLGQYITPGTAVAQIYDAAVAEIRLPLTGRQVALLNLPIDLAGDEQREYPGVILYGEIAGRPQRWHGRIVRTEAALDPNSRLYFAIAEVRNPFIAAGENTLPLMVGLFVEAQIEGRQLPNVVTLPKRALFKRDRLYVLDTDNRVRSKSVEVLSSNDEHVWVQGDIAEGERIVIDRQGYLSPGIEVEAVAVSSSDSNVKIGGRSLGE